MTGYAKKFDENKYISLLLKYDKILKKYKQIYDKIKYRAGYEFDRKTINKDQYMKNKLKS